MGCEGGFGDLSVPLQAADAPSLNGLEKSTCRIRQDAQCCPTFAKLLWRWGKTIPDMIESL